MELEVRVVAGIENCFVSLPVSLIQTLESTTASGYLPPILALELRSGNNHVFRVAWSGSASANPFPNSIQIAQQYAECIGLSDRTVVQVRVLSNLPKATMVTIEPDTEDDWEVLELNAEHAEQAILKQVAIVHEAMRFPLWLHGQTVITFKVASTFPLTPVVQLVPGTEVAVAPKRRKRNISSGEDSMMQDDELSVSKALLRVQDTDDQCIHKCEAGGVEMRVVLTSAVFIHPETASIYSFEPLQTVVIIPRLLYRETKKNHETDSRRGKGGVTSKEVNVGVLPDKHDIHQSMVRLIFSESVAKGHIMLPRSLRLYLRAELHSCVYVKRFNVKLKKEIPLVSLSPCEFKILQETGVSEENNAEVLGKKNINKIITTLLRTNSDIEMGTIDWSIHEKIAAAFSCDSSKEDKETSIKSDIKEDVAAFLHRWCLAQLHAVTIKTGVEVKSLILGNTTLLHFKVKDNRSIKDGVQTMKGGEASLDAVFVLSTSDESMRDEKIDAYEVEFDEGNKLTTSPGNFEPWLGKLQLGNGLSIRTVREKFFAKATSLTTSSLDWMGTAAPDVINRLIVLLSSASWMLSSAYEFPLPGHILIHGPSGSGKTLLATVAAKFAEESEDILAHVIFLSCSKLALEKPSAIRQTLLSYVADALDHAPSVVVFDDLDSIVAASSESEASQPSSSLAVLAEYFADIMDEYEEKRRNTCGIGPIAFIACAQSLTNLPQNLTSSGRFDFHVKLPAPATTERGALLKHIIQKRSLQCSDDTLLDVASKCDGYDAYDLEILVDRSVHAATARFLSSDLDVGRQEKPVLVKDDFLHAMHEFVPVAMRDIAKPSADGGRSGWEDVGGLNDIRNAIIEMIELPSKFPNIFAQAPLRMRSNVLLYGPPGCGKTHIVGAAAAACSLRFISVKGPELLNKYIGASEQAVRDIFSKAAAAAPCLLFFDEFDSIAPKRGHDNTGVTDRVVNQFLTELDGVEVLTGVFVFAATSRPDLLDAALLRPGRLDRLLFCDFPSPHERLEILSVLSRKLPLASDVDLDGVARLTEGFSGADLQALLSDAQLEAVHDLLDSENVGKPDKKPVISDALLKSIASKAKRSVSDAEKQRLYDIYSQFLDSKRSVAAQSRDAKGKRATLA
ncbi:peroxisomal ATPase PEX1 isoform X2 [Lycium ferocissimum]|uniref:peroxisomal ATPase PEX1 isoform X2 n=1 Tax=Lycium ferocissimum TaxID=112874 RepID=UPI0028169668|nr:peroxisomal ATPase PEX1 isoform X2 [Lycium ferocissimum]